MNIKHLIIYIVFLLVCPGLFAQIEFDSEPWANIKSKAKKEQKYIMVDAYTTWCGPCKWMANNTFMDKAVGDFYNVHFINVKLDMEKEGDGLNFAREYGVQAYPTIIFFNPSGEIVHKSLGAKDPSGFIRAGEKALAPNKQTKTMGQRYETGDKNPDFLRNYAYALVDEKDYEQAKTVAEDYLKSVGKSNWQNIDHWMFIQDFAQITAMPFDYVLENKSSFKAYSENAFYDYLNATLDDILYNVAHYQDEQLLNEFKDQLKNLLKDEAARYIAKTEYLFYIRNPDEALMVQYADKYLILYAYDWKELNSLAWKFFETSNNNRTLKKAVEWTKKSIQFDENYYNTDTLANLLFKLGQFQESKFWAEKSITFGLANNLDVSGTQALLKQIKNNL